MLNGKTLLAVVPARGGSKGIKLKNLQLLDGVPLVSRVGKLVSELGYFDRSVVSTDHPEIARVASEAGLTAPFVRPRGLSGDAVGDLDVLLHALQESERIDDRQYDVIAMLQPTSPLRRGVHVTSAITKLVEEDWDAVWTVSQVDLKYHPLKVLRVDDDGRMQLFDDRGRDIIARQQLSQLYYRNGAAYVFSRSCLKDQGTILGHRSTAVVIDESMVSIDTLEDLQRAELLLRTRESGE